MEAITTYIENTLKDGGTTDNRKIRSICEQNGIDLDTNISKVKEAVEIGLMHLARSIAQSDKTLRQKYDELIDLYNRQPYVGTKKTLKQMVLQQYSTPLPIAFLMSQFVKGQSNTSLYFEPSAGNGFLTIALPQENTICNEIDRYRLENLKNEHYRKVSEQDARQPFEYNRIFDGVVTNPPFLKGQETNTMIFNALETMKDSGRCAILRDGNAQFTEYVGTKLRSSFTGFYDRLFQEYNVVKIININAKKIYAKQGTSFFMHIILINGRRAKKLSDNDSMHRVYNPDIDKIDLAGFEELWEYFSPYFGETPDTSTINNELLCKELQLSIEVGDEFVRAKQLSIKQEAKIYDWLRTKDIKDKEIYNFFYVSYINPNGEIYLYDGQTEITEKYTCQEFAKLGLQFYKHYKHQVLRGILNGLTTEQWQNFLAEKEDWRAFQYKFGETPYHNNIITVRKPSNGGNGYIQYWFHCKKEEIEKNTNIIDKVFNMLIDEFPDWKTLNPIITYKPDKDTLNKGYYMIKRELRFTPKEGEKFLQVIPFYLKLTTISPDNIKFEDNLFIIPTLKFCKFQKVAEKVSELATKEIEFLKDTPLADRIRLNFSDAPEKVIKNLIENSCIIATQDEIKKHLQAINIKDVMWDLLANANYTEETAKYIKTKGKDPKDTRMPKWVHIIYSYLCDKYGEKQRVDI